MLTSRALHAFPEPRGEAIGLSVEMEPQMPKAQIRVDELVDTAVIFIMVLTAAEQVLRSPVLAASQNQFLSRSMRSECPVCQEDPKPQSGDSHPLQQRYLDGPQNIWALKEPCVQKGKGVTILSGLAPLLEDYEQHRATGQGRDCVAQKYIERPLLVNQPHGPAKCDLRDWNPLTVFVHPEVYFRIATRPFQFDSMEPNAHKTNCRDTENRVPMKVLFESVGHGAAERWKTRTWPRLMFLQRNTEYI
ncbi:unnamed protein product [Durusdinium trenchii]|uniref:Uncharacterized protein n=1 Tax=Durusdinium trenchii TaxID=1381693 RepID=A0ABP0NCG0_9DINO